MLRWIVRSARDAKQVRGKAAENNIARGAPDPPFSIARGAPDPPEDVTLSLAFSPDRKRIISGSPDKTVKLWDVTTKHELCTLDIPSEINSVGFSPDNRAIAVAAKDGKIRLWFAGTSESPY